MAELGDFVSHGVLKNCEVTVEMMDYKHVDKCDDVPELRSILQALKSGEHGKYPHLERHTEKRIMALIPERERKKIEALASTPSAQDLAEASNDIEAFVTEATEDDDRLRTEVFVKAGGSDERLPPVRGRKAPPKKAAKQSTPKEIESKKENRIPGYDFKAWDKYDVDKECEALDEKEKKVEDERKRRAREARERDDAKARKALEDLAACRSELGCDDLAPAERQFLSRREKNKGNEAYRASENRDAYDSYTRSLAYDASSAVVFANRAMACLRLGLLERAEDDCTCALKIDPQYHKARQRRGMTRHKRGKYALAIEDFERACADDPDNLALRKLLKQACDKFEEVEGKRADLARDPSTFTSVLIESDGDDDVPRGGFTKIQIADEDSSDEEVLEMGADGFELPSSNEDDMLAKLATEDGDDLDELVVEEVPVGGTKITIENDDDEPVAGTKMVIEDSDEDEHLLVAETVPASLQKDPPGVKVAIDDASDEEEPSTGVKVSIEDDSEDEPPPPDVSPAKSNESWEVVGDSAKAEELKKAGNALMQAGDVKGAVAKYSEALAADAQHYASRANRAMARLRSGDVEGAFLDADACCRHPDVLKDTSKRVKALFRRGDARERLAARAATPAARAAELEASLADLEEVVKLEPKNDVALAKTRAVKAALVEAKAEKPAKAQPRGQYEGDFAASDAAKAAGSTALAAGKLAEAEVLYTKALDAWPGNAAARNNRALVRLRRDDFDGCNKDASEVLKSDPTNLKALYRRGVARRALGDFGGSLDDLDALLALAPGDKAATAEKDATRQKLDERDGLTRKRTKGVVKLDAVPMKPPTLKLAPSAKVVAVDAPPPSPAAKAAPAKKAVDSQEKVQAAVAAARSRNAKKVPTKAPKTASELERAWRELKGSPDLWQAYLAIFKKKTLAKLDLSLCPEVLVDVIGSAQAALGDKAAGVLAAASKAPGWVITKALLSKEDLVRVDHVASCADDESGAKLRQGFGL